MCGVSDERSKFVYSQKEHWFNFNCEKLERSRTKLTVHATNNNINMVET